MKINALIEVLSRLTPEARSELLTTVAALTNLFSTFEPEVRTALVELLSSSPPTVAAKVPEAIKVPRVFKPDFKPPSVSKIPRRRGPTRHHFTDTEINRLFETWIDVNSRRVISQAEFVQLNYPGLNVSTIMGILSGVTKKYASFRAKYEEFFVEPGKLWVKNLKAPDPERDVPSEVVKSFADMQLNH